MRPLSRYLVMSAIVFSASIAFSLHTIANKPAAAPHDSRLAGVWLMESGVNQGQPIPSEQISGSQMIAREGSITVLDKDQAEIYRCVYNLDAVSVPHRIAMTSTMPDRAESQVLGIYKVEGDELTLCYALPGGKRPCEFRSTPDGKAMLFKFRATPEVD